MEERMPRQSVFMSELTMTDVDEYLRESDLVLVPTGSTEQHGPHSPLSTDVIIPTEVCRRVAERLGALVAPPVNYGISAGHRGFKALAYLSVPTFMAVIEDLAFSLGEVGFRRIVFINGHYTNYFPVNMACMNVSTRLPEGTHAWGVSYWETLPPEQLEEYLSMKTGLHANIGETSAVMAVRPELVDLTHAVAEWPDFPEFHSPAFPAVLAYFETNPGSVWRASRSGVWGDPRKSTAGLGKKFYRWIEDGVVRHIQDVEETYRRLNVRGSSR
jgi:creatinine amidohydrolase